MRRAVLFRIYVKDEDGYIFFYTKTINRLQIDTERWVRHVGCSTEVRFVMEGGILKLADGTMILYVVDVIHVRSTKN